MPVIKVIVGSTRPSRFGEKPAKWLMELTKEHPEATFELIDLLDVNLPFLDEPQPPLMGNYTKDHTLAWATTIGEADGFVFITPEYNHAPSPALLNAVDFLAKEWKHKPVAFVSYGANAGGSRAVEHLRAIVGNLHMYDLNDHVAFVNYWEYLDESGNLKPTEQHVASANALLSNLAFWANKLKDARAELAAQA